MICKKVFFIGLVAVAVAVGGPLFGLGCTANVQTVIVATNGGVQATMSGAWGDKVFSVCNLEQTTGLVAPETCKALRSQLVVAQTTNVLVVFQLDGTYGGATCADIATFYPGWVPFYNISHNITLTENPSD